MNSLLTLQGLGAGGLGLALAFPNDLNCQACNPPLGQAALEVPRFGFPPSVFCLLNFSRWILN
ncbi:hypothetical protein [Nostoc sp.]|uniref:hypothetical protein n=1 Tax=Nostoc sp. TaxID=1180 RepID=UPI002FFA6851